MNEETTQEQGTGQELGLSEAGGMSDDDIAALLGFNTTISEQNMGVGQEDDLQEEEPSDSRPEPKQPEGRKDSIDDEQQAEIDDIRRELEALKNGNEPEPTKIQDTVPVE